VTKHSGLCVGLAVAYAAACALLSPALEGFTTALPAAVLVAAGFVVGPPTFLLLGLHAWPAAALSTGCVVFMLVAARRSYRRSPETEWWAVWLLAAAVIWVASPFVAAIALW